MDTIIEVMAGSVLLGGILFAVLVIAAVALLFINREKAKKAFIAIGVLLGIALLHGLFQLGFSIFILIMRGPIGFLSSAGALPSLVSSWILILLDRVGVPLALYQILFPILILVLTVIMYGYIFRYVFKNTKNS
jgi:asparagine N-glycosylation enzyme membrane subunit Stt3